MKRFLHIIVLAALVCLFPLSLSAQKQLGQYDPEALFSQGVTYFENQEYGAAQTVFERYLTLVSDKKQQRAVDAQYYEAVSALYLGKGDGEAKVMKFVKENPGSTWANHANFLYANMLFQNRKYRDALAIYEKTVSSSLSSEEAQQLQFNMGYSYFQTENIDKAIPIFHGASLNEGKYQDASKYYYAHLQYVKGKGDLALPYFRQLRNSPDYSKIVPAYIVQIDYANGDYQTVIDEGPDAIRDADGKHKAEVARIVADACFQQKDYRKALEYYQVYSSHLSGKNASREALYQMGTCKMKTGDYTGAIDDLQKIAGGDDAIGQYASYYLAYCYDETNQPKFARNAYYAAYSAGFDDAISEESLFNYAKLSLMPGVDPFCEAVEQLDRFVAKNPKSSRVTEAEELSIYLLLNAKNNDEAITRLEKMNRKSRAMQNIYNNLLYSTGVENFQKGDYDKAVSYFSKVFNSSQSSEKKAESCFWLGESAYTLKDYDAAERYLKQYKSTEGAHQMKEYPMADYDLGYVYFQKPDYQSATSCFRNFIQSCDDRQSDLKSDAYLRLGDCSFMQRNYDNAINYYDMATRVGKRNADYALFQSGLCYGAQGDANQKIAALNEMTSRYSGSKYYEQALYEIGNTHLVHNDQRSAIAAFSRLVKERPRSSYTRQAMLKVGMLYYNNNQYDQAMSTLKALVESHPNTDESREAMTIIRSIFMEKNDLDSYFAYAKSSGQGQVEVSEQDSLAFANAENFYFESRYDDAAKAYQYYFDNFGQGAYLLKAHQHALECAERKNDKNAMMTHLNYILAQNDNEYTDNALLKMARIEYDNGDYSKAGHHYQRLSQLTNVPQMQLEALEGGMKSNFFMGNYDTAISMGEDLFTSDGITADQVNQINHIVGKSYFEKGEYVAAMQKLDKSAKADRSVYGAESAYYSALCSLKLGKYDEVESKVFNISDNFSSHTYWVAKSFIALADVYVAKRNYFQAKETLRSVIDNYNGNDLKEEARAKLAEVERLQPAVGQSSNGILPVEDGDQN